jgi:hypothetical protein
VTGFAGNRWHIEHASAFRSVRITAHDDRRGRRNGVSHQRVERLAVTPAVAMLEHLRVDRKRGRRVLMADLALDVRDGCAGLEHQRDERAAEGVCGDRSR